MSATSSTPASAPPRARRFYGWTIVIAVFVILTVCSGVTVYNLSVYLHAFLASGRFTISEVSFASATFSIASGVAGLWVGKLLERHDIRVVMTLGILQMAVSLICLPLVDRLWVLYAFHVLLGIGYATSALIPCTTIVVRWFSLQRSTAMSIAATGNSFGAIAVTPASAALVSHIGLSASGPWLALTLALGTLPITWLLLKSWPRDMGLTAWGEHQASAEHPAPVDTTMTYEQALTTRYYWAAVVSFLFAMAAQVAGMTHAYNLFMERTADESLAGLAIAVMAGASISGRFIAVAALKRMSARAFIFVMLITQGIALAACGVSTIPVTLLLSIAVFGSTIGNLVTLQSVMLTDAFGIQAYARLYALSRFFAVFGVAFGPGLIGLLHERTGNYTEAFSTVGLISAVSIIALMLSGPAPSPTLRPTDA